MVVEDLIKGLYNLKEYLVKNPIELNGYKSLPITLIDYAIEALEQEPKTGHCKDCKWWKDSDGSYCRGVHAESKCPINRKEVYEGNGYCYMFEPQESEE